MAKEQLTVNSLQFTADKKLFARAKKYIPGGVNSPVRAFKAVDGYPVFMKRARSSRIYSEYNKEFIDYCLSWGALILGHSHPVIVKALNQAIKNGTSFGTVTKLEIELAQLINAAIPSIEQVRLTNSGTEAVMSAIRLARAYTKKKKIIKFEGSYHGHVDYLLTSRGVPEDFSRLTIALPYNNTKRLEETAERFHNDLAAVIVEPIAANCGVILPEEEFLNRLRKITARYNIVLIFDEVITGFRISYAGAQGLFNIRPDLTCLGKIIGGGLPVGAFGGKKEIMKLLAPDGKVYQAGTLSGNPIAVTAGIATLKILKQKNPYKILEENTKKLCYSISLLAKKYAIDCRVNYIGSMFSIFFTDKEVIDYNTAKAQNTKLFSKFFHRLLQNGIYFSPSGFEANFLSTAHTKDDINKTTDIIDRIFKTLRRKRG